MSKEVFNTALKDQLLKALDKDKKPITEKPKEGK